MNHFSIFTSIVALAALAACAAPPPPPVATAPASVVTRTPEPAARCVAEPAKFAVGQSYSAQLEAATRHRSGASSVRVLKPGQMATMEVDAGRLTLDVDARGRVSNARCG
jgi:hypothetical protein